MDNAGAALDGMDNSKACSVKNSDPGYDGSAKMGDIATNNDGATTNNGLLTIKDGTDVGGKITINTGNGINVIDVANKG